MIEYRIDCVNKPNRTSAHEHITQVGGPNPSSSGRWKKPTAEVVSMIEQGRHCFYTNESGAAAWVGVRTSAAGNKFLQTHADGVSNDNLLALKECA